MGLHIIWAIFFGEFGQTSINGIIGITDSGIFVCDRERTLKLIYGVNEVQTEGQSRTSESNYNKTTDLGSIYIIVA